jgi:hypothetical protein
MQTGDVGRCGKEYRNAREDYHNNFDNEFCPDF